MARSLIFALGGGTLVTAAAVAGWIVTQMREDTPAPPATPLPIATDVPPAASAQPPAVAPSGPVAPAMSAPGFDVVRVDRDGGALVAGRAQPGAAVTLRVDDAVVAQVAADENGQFVALFSLGHSTAVQSMTLEVTDGAGAVTQAPDIVILTPRPPPADTVAQADTPAAPPIVSAPALGETAGSAPAGEAPASAESPRIALLAPSATGAPGVSEDAVATVSVVPEGAPAIPRPATSPGGDQVGAVTTPAPGIATTAPAPARMPDPPVAQTVAPEAQAPQTPRPETLAQAVPAPLDPPQMPAAFLVQGDGGVRVLDRAPSVLDNVVIDSISYSGAGDVQIAGRAAHSAPEANLRIYLDNRPIAVTRADSGDWTSDLPSVDPGVYTLRVDQLNDAGGVVSRFETPFQREAPEVVAAARAGNEPNAQTAATPDPTAPLAPAADAAPAQAPRAALITVQPGNTLWAISQARYGAGERYVVIYNANRSQIRDPDLIYPGQVFALPDE
ncbi:MAG: LysM peptidoglycan-binding domain-containing protein [Rhodobacter sp.]|nr:LysM peptidoglycan-binding domain-containing protein [Rhodobacter sp.]